MDNYEKLLEEKIENAWKDYAAACQQNKELSKEPVEITPQEIVSQTMRRWSVNMRMSRLQGELEAYQDALNEYRHTHAYQVFFVNEDDVMEDLGFFHSLEEAEKELNLRLETYSAHDQEREGEFFTPRFGPGERLGRLQVYQGEYGPCMDVMIDCDEGLIQVRGVSHVDR